MVESSPQDKTISKWIVRIKVEFVPARDGRRTADFRNDCVVWSKPGHFHCLNRHHAADNALNRNSLIEFQIAPGEVNCRARADARAGGRTVDLSFGKDADVATVMA